MAKKLYGNNIRKACEVCAHGRRSADGSVMLCPYKGAAPLYHLCRKFVYDPLKRIPSAPLAPKDEYSAEDFSID